MNLIDRHGLVPVIAALAGVLVLLSCEQPFRAGLGTIVDAERPGISLTSPDGGSLIRGNEQTFTGQGWDDLRVSSVQFRITAYPGLVGSESRVSTDWQDVRMGYLQRTGGRVFHAWEHTVDISAFRDGELRIRLRVSDGVERDGSLWTESEDMAFFIRNTPPAISMSLPVVDEGTELGQLGGPHLNFNFMYPGNVSAVSGRGVDSDAGMFAGTINDNLGVNRVGDPATGRRPPEFRLWEISDDVENLGQELRPYIPIVRYNELTEEWVDALPWREFGYGGSGIIDISPTSALFFYRFPAEVSNGRKFAFQVRAQNVPLEGHFDEFLFPADLAPPSPGQRLENSFVAFLIVPRQDPPDLELLALQNVFDMDSWDPDLRDGLGDYRDMPGLGDDARHPYVTDPAFNAKSGAFTLRVRASHASDISHAMAFWEGGGQRGRFIWDPVGDDVSPTLPFSRWGRGDPNLRKGDPDVASHRNFVITYRGDGTNYIPGSYHAGVGGRYQIQRFAGTDAQWEDLYLGISSPAGWSAFYDSGLWEDHRLAEGVFSIRVYARTPAGSTNAVPLVTSLTLDGTPPVVELSQLDGAAGETTVGGQTARIVNGAVRPRIFTHDSRGFDSGPRVSGGYFARPNGLDAEEVMFLLVPGASRDAMESLGRDFWPLPRAAGGDWDPAVCPYFPPGVTVSRHGPIHDSVAYIQTSCLGCDQNDCEPLDDGVYWLYVFARDRAFNVARAAFPLVVDAESDRPAFDFSIGLINRGENPVTDPNRAADKPGSGYYGAGFRHHGVVRNMLRPTTDIRFRVRDDDGLDLGVAGGAPSSMRISFTGSFVDGNGTVRPLTDRDPGFLVEFSDEQVKGIFRPKDTAESPAPREREGIIPQSMLLDLLRDPANIGWSGGMFTGNPAAYNSLPDGIYRMVVEIEDDPAARVRMPGRPPGEPLRNTVEFWLAVDNVPPAVHPGLGYVYPPNEQRVPLDYFEIRSQEVSGDWLGTIRDDNGPVTVAGFTVSVSEATRLVNGVPEPANFDPVDVLGLVPGPTRPGLDGQPCDSWARLFRMDTEDTWEYKLQVVVKLDVFFPGIMAGNFTFALTLEDRFGNPLTIERRHQQDEVPPTVTLTRPIETFTRPSLEGWYPDAVDPSRIWVSREHAAGSPAQPAGYLANRVVGFTAHAFDNFTVAGLHWWLLPAGTGVSIGSGSATPGSLTGDGVVGGFFGYPAMRDSPGAPSGRAIPVRDSGGSVVGAFGRLAAPGGTAYIDTHGMGLPDGEYVLHIVARDAHGNDSAHPRQVQTVFLLQEEDRPYFFAGVSPDAGDVRGEHTLRVTGIIMDDDGFGAGVGPEPGSVRIWVSRTPLPPGTELNSAALDAAWHGIDVSDGLTLSGRDIILNLDLLALFGRDALLYVHDMDAWNAYAPGHPNRNPNAPGLVRRDGTVHYVIRARDAWQSKLQITGTPVDQTRVSNYRAFSFTLDSLAPRITLASPSPAADASDRIFPGDFRLAGEISDVHLSTMPDGRPYILWTLGDHSPAARFPLDSLEGERGVGQIARFDVPMSALLLDSHDPPAWVSGFDAMFDDEGMDGEYTLELTVVDGLGLADVATLNFTIDRRPPAVGVTFPGGAESVGMTQGDFDLWHNRPARPAQDLHNWRRGWAADGRELPVVSHDRLEAPTLSGSVVDAFSDIPLNAAGVPDISFLFNDGSAPHRVEWVGEGRNWRWEIPLATAAGILDDGAHTLSIIDVRDSVGAHGNRAAVAHFAFRTDSRAPDLALQNQPGHLLVLGAADRFPGDRPVLTVGGTARDPNLRNVRIRFVGPDGGARHTVFVTGDVWDNETGVPPGQASVAPESVEGSWAWLGESLGWELAWSYDLSREVYGRFAAGNTYSIEVVALDWRRTGGASEPETWAFTKDTATPEIRFFADVDHSNAPGGMPDNPDFTPGDAARVFGSDADSIRGTVRDLHSDVSRVESRIERWNWDVPGWEAARPWTAMDGVASTNRGWETPALGDAAGGLGDGLYRIQVRAMDSSWFTGSAPGFGHDDTRGNPVYSNWFYFYFDREVPDLGFQVTPPQTMSSLYGTGATGPGSLGFHVAAMDHNRLARVSAGIYAPGDPPVQVPGAEVTVSRENLGSGENWDGVLSIPMPVGLNGPHTVIVRAYDLAGRHREIRRGFVLDNIPPGGSFALPDLGEELGGDLNVVISGETTDTGVVESGPARAWMRFGLLNGVPPTADALAIRYVPSLAGGASGDTARNDGFFAGADNWHEIGGETAPALPHFGAADSPADQRLRVTRNVLFSWELQASTVNLLALAQADGMSITIDGGFLEMPVWFRVVDAAGNAGYFGRSIVINPEADRPVNRVETPAVRVGERHGPRGGAVTFDGIAEIGQPAVYVDHVLYRVWVGRPRPAPGTPTPPGFVLWTDDPSLPPSERKYYFLRVATPVDLLGLPMADIAGVTGANGLLAAHGLWAASQRYWFPATLDSPGSNVTPWNFRLNSGGELTALMNTVDGRPGVGFDLATGLPSDANDMLFVMVETIAVNGNAADRKMSIGGPDDGGTFTNPRPNRRMFYLRDTAPAIFATREYQQAGTNRGTASVAGSSNRGTGPANPHGGTVTVTAYLDAMEGQEISGIRIVRPEEGAGLNQEVALETIHTPALPGLSLTWIEGRRVARLVYALDTEVHVNNGAWARGGGLYRVEIRVSDDMDPPSETTLTLPIVIDNFAPVADSGYDTPPVRVGTGEVFQGRVLDGSRPLVASAVTIDGTHAGAGIDRIYAWFESGVNPGGTPTFIGLFGDSLGRPVTSTVSHQVGNVFTGRNASVAGTGIDFSPGAEGDPSSVTVPGTALPGGVGNDWVMRISAEHAATQAGRERGQLWIEYHGGRDVLWQFTVNTTALPDGPLTLRYIVFDRAGNAASYEQRVVVQNNAPMFSGITLRSLDAAGVPVTADLSGGTLGQVHAAGFIDATAIAGFTARGRSLGFDVETHRGNAPLDYRLQHVTRTRIPLTTANLRRLADPAAAGVSLYTLDDPGGITPAIWNLLVGGVASAPTPGAHFVPRLTMGDIDGGEGDEPLNLPDVFVWEYAPVGGGRSLGPAGYRGNNANPPFNVSFEAGEFAAYLDATGVIGHGENFFLVRVFDSVTAENPPTTPAGLAGWIPSPARIERAQLHAAAVIRMKVFLFDTEPPAALLHDLNPFFEAGVAPGNNLSPAARNATIANALAPHAAGRTAGGVYLMANRNRGGLFNARTTGEPARSGHIEPRGGDADSRSSMFASPPPSWLGFEEANRNYARQSAFAVDQVSGRVILRGRATDNERVQYVDLAITPDSGQPGSGAAAGDWFRILQWDQSARRMVMVPRQSVGPGFVRRVPADDGTAVPDVGVAESLDDGHVVEWSFLWDTELANSGAPAAGVRVSVRVTDSQGVAVVTGWDAADRLFDVVPYVTGFERLARYRTIRSMQGWYSFYEGETGIAALGFNLGGPPAMVTAPAELAGITLDPIATAPSNRVASPLGGNHRIAFTVPNYAHSGRINFTVGGSGIHNHLLNHRGSVDQFWNRYDHLLGDRAALWNNRLYAHVWRTRHHTTVPTTFMGPNEGAGSVGLDHPGMALQPAQVGATANNRNRAGMLHGTWSVFANAQVHYGTNHGSAAGSGAAESNTSLSSNASGEPFVQPDIGMFPGAAVPNIVFIHQGDGQPEVRFRANVHSARSSAAGAGTPSNADWPRLINNSAAPTQRFSNIRTAKASANSGGAGQDPGVLFTTVYDSHNRSLVFVAQTGPSGIGTGAAVPNRTQVNLDGGTGGGFTNVAAGGSRIDRTTDAGMSNAIGISNAGAPIVVYWDATNDVVRMAFSTSTTSGFANTTWTRRELIPAGVNDALRVGSGRYVSMAVEPAGSANPGRVHVAFFNSVHRALVYTYGTTADAASFGRNARIVDTLPGVGTWTDISVDHWGRPWIVYGYQARSNGFDGARVAYRSRNDANSGGGLGFTRILQCPVSGHDIGDWEAVQMAAPFRVINDRLNIESWPPGGLDAATVAGANMGMNSGFVNASTGNRPWSAAIGFRGGAPSGGVGAAGDGNDRFRVGYFFWPTGTFGGQ